MSSMTETELDRARVLMMAVLDGECEDPERRDLEALLAGSRELREEWQAMQEVKEATRMIDFRNPPQELWRDYWEGVYARLERGIAWTFIALGSSVLLGWGTWKVTMAILANAALPSAVKLAAAAMLIGSVILLVSVLREKLTLRCTDRYKDIER